MLKDLQQAFRSQGRCLKFTAIVILTLGLGIAPAAAMFAVVDAILFKPLPYRDPGRLLRVYETFAFQGSRGLGSVSAGIAEALVTTALGLFVAIPAVWLYNLFLNKIERFQVEMSNSSSELIDYFMKRQATKAA